LKKEDKVTNGSLFELKLKPSLQAGTPLELSEVQKFMEDLQSSNEVVVKKACVALRNEKMKAIMQLFSL
jgi:hypothetical protein